MEKRVGMRARGPLFASTALLGLGVALAAPGDLDPGFNGSGVLSLSLGLVSDATAVVQQPDGKLVIVGWGELSGRHDVDFIAVRIAEDGTRDSTFGSDGVASADFSFAHDFAEAVVQQPDGKLVLAGTASLERDIALARFNVNGTLDATFGSDGRATLDLGGDRDTASGLIQQPGGKFVIAGATNSGGSYRLVFARFNVDGSLDTTFGIGGTTFVDFGGGISSWANDLAQQPDGRLVAVGGFTDPTSAGFAIARVTADGALDPTFDGDGLLAVEIAGDAMSVAIQSDDAIVVAGGEALVRINGDGSLDNGFGSAGKVLIDLGESSFLNSIVAQADGRLVATGFTYFDRFDMILARFESNGALDTSYGFDGVATADFGAGAGGPFDSRGAALIRQADGKYVAVGSANLYSIGAARFDDDATFAGRIGLTYLGSNVSEASPTVTYTVRRTGGRTGAVSVNYATTAGTAQPGSDFQNATGTLSWGDGDSSEKTFTVNIINDVLTEAIRENFTLTLSAPTGGAQLAASESITTVIDDDGPGEFSFDPFRNPTSRTEGESNIRVVVGRLHGSKGEVSVSYTTKGTATPGVDFAISGTLVWADGDIAPKFIDVDYLEDAVVEGNESFQIELAAPTGGATISGGSGRRQTMIIVDNDDGFVLPETAVSVNENGGSVQIRVARIDALNRAGSVDYSTADGTAVAGSDYSAASGTLTWAAGDASVKTIEIVITNDQAAENDESFTVSLSNPTGGLALESNSTTNVTIAANDSPPPPPPRGGNGGGGGTNGLDLLALLGLLKLFAPRVRRIRRRETRPGLL